VTDAAYKVFARANDGHTASIDPAAQEYARLVAQFPTDPLVRVYAGAATAMRAYTTILPWKKIRYAEEGLAEIDKALAFLTPAHDTPRPDGTPVALETRFVAASTFLTLPGFFNRGPRGERMLKEVLASPQFAGAPLTLRAPVWMAAAKQAIEEKRKDDARRFLQLVISSNAAEAAAAGELLKDLAS
jgi:hypothetical protein